MPYDWTNGLVYDETVVSSKDRKHEERCMATLLPRPKSATLTRPWNSESKSLQDMAIRLLCRHAESLEPDVLRDLPDAMLNRILQAINHSQSMTLRVWTTFAKTGRFKSAFFRYVMAGCLSCTMDFGMLASLINSPSLDWITDMSLELVQLSTSEMIKIADIANLRTLYIRASDERRPLALDQVIRAWSALAKERRAFPILKTVFLDMGEKKSLSPWLFHYLNSFPALETVALRAPYVNLKRAKSESKQFGWREGKDSSFMTFARGWVRVSLTETTRPLFWGELVPDFLLSQRKHDLIELGDKPILKIQCGDPDRQAFKYDHLLCFQRDRDSERQQAATKLAANKTEDHEDRPTKKRKIKTNEQRSLDDVLAGIHRTSFP